MASGSLLSVNPDRLIVKKIILTGRIIKIHKRRAIVKDMFYNPGMKRSYVPNNCPNFLPIKARPKNKGEN